MPGSVPFVVKTIFQNWQKSGTILMLGKNFEIMLILFDEGLFSRYAHVGVVKKIFHMNDSCSDTFVFEG